jgi:hypothetical protein
VSDKILPSGSHPGTAKPAARNSGTAVMRSRVPSRRVFHSRGGLVWFDGLQAADSYRRALNTQPRTNHEALEPGSQGWWDDSYGLIRPWDSR